ncbi:MAG: type I-E CRISPR-associated protein Cas5/CasD [Desulfovibrio sp.]|nr:type I-E CRISPR-associated protein Cas5/CasD [Desulfovibrio sp.]
MLWLEAPLQSWGADSRYGRRDTLPFPTRSGVLGLLCCAMGRGGEQRDWLEAMRPCSLTVLAFTRRNGNVRNLQPLLRDFHMVGSGYDDADPWQNMLIPKTSEGKKPNGSGTKLTHRYYLQDMAFACLLEVPSDFEEELRFSLEAPVWPIFLGRKCCVPTSLIFRGFFDSLEEAEFRAREIATSCERINSMKIIECFNVCGTTMTLNDVPLSFGLYKKYTDRVVTIFYIDNNI